MGESVLVNLVDAASAPDGVEAACAMEGVGDPALDAGLLGWLDDEQAASMAASSTALAPGAASQDRRGDAGRFLWLWFISSPIRCVGRRSTALRRRGSE